MIAAEKEAIDDQYAEEEAEAEAEWIAFKKERERSAAKNMAKAEAV